MACDVECHRQKKLKALQDAYITASHKAGSDPEGYEQAKIAYFSARDGPTWLHEYNKQKQEREQEQQRRKQKQIDDHAPQQPEPITEDSYEFTRFLQKKRDTLDINQRIFELQGSWFSWDYVELALTIILSLYCVYQLFTKLPKFLNYFGINS